MYKFLLAVTVVGLTACSTEKTESKAAPKADSTVAAPAADSTAKAVDTLKTVEVKPQTK